MKVIVLFYSRYGHIFKMAEAVAEGIGEVEGAEAVLMRVPETLSDDILAKMGATDAQKGMAHIPVATVDDIGGADALFIGTPTRFGNMCGQMKQFIDSMGKLWMSGAMVGQVGSVITSSNTQHGGQEATIISAMRPLFPLGLIVVGLPYAFQGQMRMDEITGCSPYGASTIAGKGERMPSDNELDGARFQGKHVAQIALKLVK